MIKRHTRAEQLRHIEAWQRSGLTKTQYCQQHHVTVHSFYSWMKNTKNNHDDASSVVPAFIPARRIAGENTRTETVTLHLPNGCSVSCFPAQLMGVMQALSLC